MAVQVRFEGAHARTHAGSARVPAGTRLLDAARGAGLPLASGCGAHGLCGRCAVEIASGGESLEPARAPEREALHRNRQDPHMRLACCVRVTADLTVRTSYW